MTSSIPPSSPAPSLDLAMPPPRSNIASAKNKRPTTSSQPANKRHATTIGPRAWPSTFPSEVYSSSSSDSSSSDSSSDTDDDDHEAPGVRARRRLRRFHDDGEEDVDLERDGRRMTTVTTPDLAFVASARTDSVASVRTTEAQTEEDKKAEEERLKAKRAKQREKAKTRKAAKKVRDAVDREEKRRQEEEEKLKKEEEERRKKGDPAKKARKQERKAALRKEEKARRATEEFMKAAGGGVGGEVRTGNWADEMEDEEEDGNELEEEEEEEAEEVIDFDDFVRARPSPSTSGKPTAFKAKAAPTTSSSSRPQSRAALRQAYSARLASDPSFVPKIGAFYGHDERLLSDELKGIIGKDGPQNAGRKGKGEDEGWEVVAKKDKATEWRSRAPMPAGRPGWSEGQNAGWGRRRDQPQWNHDGYEELEGPSVSRDMGHQSLFRPPQPRWQNAYSNNYAFYHPRELPWTVRATVPYLFNEPGSRIYIDNQTSLPTMQLRVSLRPLPQLLRMPWYDFNGRNRARHWAGVESVDFVVGQNAEPKKTDVEVWEARKEQTRVIVEKGGARECTWDSWDEKTIKVALPRKGGGAVAKVEVYPKSVLDRLQREKEAREKQAREEEERKREHEEEARIRAAEVEKAAMEVAKMQPTGILFATDEPATDGSTSIETNTASMTAEEQATLDLIHSQAQAQAGEPQQPFGAPPQPQDAPYPAHLPPQGYYAPEPGLPQAYYPPPPHGYPPYLPHHQSHPSFPSSYYAPPAFYPPPRPAEQHVTHSPHPSIDYPPTPPSAATSTPAPPSVNSSTFFTPARSSGKVQIRAPSAADQAKSHRRQVWAKATPFVPSSSKLAKERKVESAKTVNVVEGPPTPALTPVPTPAPSVTAEAEAEREFYGVDPTLGYEAGGAVYYYPPPPPPMMGMEMQPYWGMPPPPMMMQEQWFPPPAPAGPQPQQEDDDGDESGAQARMEDPAIISIKPRSKTGHTHGHDPLGGTSAPYGVDYQQYTQHGGYAPQQPMMPMPNGYWYGPPADQQYGPSALEMGEMGMGPDGQSTRA